MAERAPAEGGFSLLDEPGLLSRILLLADSALPVGAFSHSFGLESVFAGRSFARGDRELEELLAAWLECEWAGVDGPAFALAHRAARAGDLQALQLLDRRVHAMRLPAEWRRGASQIGRQLLRLTCRLCAAGGLRGGDEPGAHQDLLHALLACVEEERSPGQHCVAAGAVYAAWGVPLRASLAAFLTSAVQSLVAAAVRLVPLGQVEGQILATRLAARSLHLVDRATRATGVSELGGCAPYFEVEGMNHEILETRLFIS